MLNNRPPTFIVVMDLFWVDFQRPMLGKLAPTKPIWASAPMHLCAKPPQKLSPCVKVFVRGGGKQGGGSIAISNQNFPQSRHFPRQEPKSGFSGEIQPRVEIVRRRVKGVMRPVHFANSWLWPPLIMEWVSFTPNPHSCIQQRKEVDVVHYSKKIRNSDESASRYVRNKLSKYIFIA